MERIETHLLKRELLQLGRELLCEVKPEYDVDPTLRAKADVAWYLTDPPTTLAFFEIQSGVQTTSQNVSKVIDDAYDPVYWPGRIVVVAFGAASVPAHHSRWRTQGGLAGGLIRFVEIISVDFRGRWQEQLRTQVISALDRSLGPTSGLISPAIFFNRYRPLLDGGCGISAAELVWREAQLALRLARSGNGEPNRAFCIALAAAELLQKIGRVDHAYTLIQQLRGTHLSTPSWATENWIERLDRIEAKLVLQRTRPGVIDQSLKHLDHVVETQSARDRLPAQWRADLLRALPDPTIVVDDAVYAYQESVNVLGPSESSVAKGNIHLFRALMHGARGQWDAMAAELQNTIQYHLSPESWGATSHDTIAPLKTALNDILAVLLAARLSASRDNDCRELLERVATMLRAFGVTPRCEGTAEVGHALIWQGVAIPEWDCFEEPLRLSEAASIMNPALHLEVLKLANESLSLLGLEPLVVTTANTRRT